MIDTPTQICYNTHQKVGVLYHYHQQGKNKKENTKMTKIKTILQFICEVAFIAAICFTSLVAAIVFD